MYILSRHGASWTSVCICVHVYACLLTCFSRSFFFFQTELDSEITCEQHDQSEDFRDEVLCRSLGKESSPTSACSSCSMTFCCTASQNWWRAQVAATRVAASYPSSIASWSGCLSPTLSNQTITGVVACSR